MQGDFVHSFTRRRDTTTLLLSLFYFFVAGVIFSTPVDTVWSFALALMLVGIYGFHRYFR